MGQEIEIIIYPDGKLEIEAKGFKNSSCLSALEDLEKVFGKAEDVKLKPEARQKHKAKKKTLKA